MANALIPHDRSEMPEPHDRCGATAKRTRQPCQRPAGWGTDHPGLGRCKLHGGATPIRSGRYSGIKRDDFKARIDRFLADPDPLDLADEIAMLRAFLEDFVDRWDDIFGPDGALLAWHESFNTGESIPKPRQMPDFATLTVLVDRVGKMVERTHKMKTEGAISMATLMRVVEQMGADLVAAINEQGLSRDQSERLVRAIETRWRSIRLDSGRAGNQRDSQSSSTG